MTPDDGNLGNTFSQEWLTAYLDGELSVEQRRTVETAILEDTKLARLMDQLQATRELLRSSLRETEARHHQPADLPRPAVVSWSASVPSISMATHPEKAWLRELDDGLETSENLVNLPKAVGFFSSRTLAAIAASLVGLATIGAWLWLMSPGWKEPQLASHSESIESQPPGQLVPELAFSAENAMELPAADDSLAWILQRGIEAAQNSKSRVKSSESSESLQGIDRRMKASKKTDSQKPTAQTVLTEFSWYHTPHWSGSEVAKLCNSHPLLQVFGEYGNTSTSHLSDEDSTKIGLEAGSPIDSSIPVAVVRVSMDESQIPSGIIESWQLTPEWPQPHESIRILFVSNRQIQELVSGLRGVVTSEIIWLDDFETTQELGKGILVIHFSAPT